MRRSKTFESSSWMRSSASVCRRSFQAFELTFGVTSDEEGGFLLVEGRFVLVLGLGGEDGPATDGESGRSTASTCWNVGWRTVFFFGVGRGRGGGLQWRTPSFSSSASEATSSSTGSLPRSTPFTSDRPEKRLDGSGKSPSSEERRSMISVDGITSVDRRGEGTTLGESSAVVVAFNESSTSPSESDNTILLLVTLTLLGRWTFVAGLGVPMSLSESSSITSSASGEGGGRQHFPLFRRSLRSFLG